MARTDLQVGDEVELKPEGETKLRYRRRRNTTGIVTSVGVDRVYVKFARSKSSNSEVVCHPLDLVRKV